MSTLLHRLKETFSAAPKAPSVLTPQLDAYLVGQYIGQVIRERRPALISRLGWTEATCLGIFLESGEKSEEELRQRIWRFSGVFPPTESQFADFAREYLGAISDVDLMGLLSSPHEKLLVEKYGKDPLLTSLGSLEPYYVADPWSQWLAGKKVLVVHPFVESIKSQYSSVRERIFLNPKVLPEFDLQVVPAPQTIAGNSSEYESWNAGLKFLRDEVSRRDFDVAILGCGAYGLPLGATIKKLGKVCVHLGGSTQILFGITGARWKTQPAFRALQTDAWITPLESERPANWQKVEGGCYW